jgi:hypothetical protein
MHPTMYSLWITNPVKFDLLKTPVEIIMEKLLDDFRNSRLSTADLIQQVFYYFHSCLILDSF